MIGVAKGMTTRRCCMDKDMEHCCSCEDVRVSDVNGRIRIWCSVDKEVIPLTLTDDEKRNCRHVDIATLSAAARFGEESVSVDSLDLTYFEDNDESEE